MSMPEVWDRTSKLLLLTCFDIKTTYSTPHIGTYMHAFIFKEAGIGLSFQNSLKFQHRNRFCVSPYFIYSHNKMLLKTYLHKLVKKSKF